MTLVTSRPSTYSNEIQSMIKPLPPSIEDKAIRSGPEGEELTSCTPLLSRKYFDACSHITDLKVLRTPKDPHSISDRYLSPGQNISDTYVRFLGRQAEKYREWRDCNLSRCVSEKQKAYHKAGKKLTRKARTFVMEYAKSSSKAVTGTEWQRGLTIADMQKMAEEVDDHMQRQGWTPGSKVELEIDGMKFEAIEEQSKEQEEEKSLMVAQKMKELFGKGSEEDADGEDREELAHIYSFDQGPQETTEEKMDISRNSEMSETIVNMAHGMPTPPPSPMSTPTVNNNLRRIASLDSDIKEDFATTASLSDSLSATKHCCANSMPTSESRLNASSSQLSAEYSAHIVRRHKFYADLQSIRRDTLDRYLSEKHRSSSQATKAPSSLFEDTAFIKRVLHLCNFFLAHPPEEPHSGEYDYTLAPYIITELKGLTGFFVDKVLAALKTDYLWQHLLRLPRDGTPEYREEFRDEERNRHKNVLYSTGAGPFIKFEYSGWKEGEEKELCWVKMKLRGRILKERRNKSDSSREDALVDVIEKCLEEYEDESSKLKQDVEAWMTTFEEDEDEEQEDIH